MIGSSSVSPSKAMLMALAGVLHPRMLWLMIWPMLVAVAFWGLVALFLWVKTALWLAGVLGGWIEPWLGTLSGWVSLDLGFVTMVLSHLLLFLFYVPLVYLTALFILGLFGMDAIVEHVASRHYPQLARRRGGSVAGSVWNGMVTVSGMIGLFILSIPLWFIPPLWPLIPVAVLGWVNQRVLRYDALAAHANADEMLQVFRAKRMGLYWLGVVLALLAYIPVVGLFAPVIFGLAFVHYTLGALAELRNAPIDAEVLGVEAASPGGVGWNAGR